MRVLILGATGLIGSAIVARLRRDGIGVTAIARGAGTAARRLAADRLLRLDLGEVTDPAAWREPLRDIDAVVNAAGLLQDGGGDSTWAVHYRAPAALYAACDQAGVRRIVHISALGADRAPASDFSRSKQAIEQTLAATGLDWVILRPAVVIGRPAYGGSALFRALASLPLQPVLADAAPIQVVHLDDVVETVAHLVRPVAPSQIALDLAAPQSYRFEEVVASYRAWLGWQPARPVRVPACLMGIAYRLGDLAGWLGWRPPVRSTVRRELARGAVGDPSEWIRLTGIVPRSMDEALAAEPASVQDRWFARMFLLKPLILIVFALFWVATALVSLGPGYAIAESLMRAGGGGELSGPAVIAGALADLVVGAGILYRPTAKRALQAALALSLAYVVAGSVLMPNLWADPLGPLLKIWPILALNLAALAILEDR